MKIAIVGDLHIAPVPSNRIDDYFNVALDKINQIAIENDVVIFLGDIFSRPKVDKHFENTLIDYLWQCKTDYETKFYTIIGNHDVQSELETELHNSSLGTLAAARAMDIIIPGVRTTFIDGQFTYNFNTVPVKFRDVKSFLDKQKYDSNDILLIHHEYETGTNRLTYDDLKGLGCRMVFFGHDHCPLPEGRILYPELTVYRSGSLMRNIAQDYNFTRQVYYYVLENGKVSCKAIKQQDAKDIFTIESYTRQNYYKKQFTESIDELIEKYTNNVSKQDKFSIKTILEELNAPENVVDYIKKKYESIGEMFV